MRRLATLPGEALALYMDRAGREARQLMENTALRRDESVLEKIIARFPLSGEAFWAMLATGDLAFERGGYLRAARAYRRCLEEAAFLKETLFELEADQAARARRSLYIALRSAGFEEEAAPFRPKTPFLLGGEEVRPEELDRLLASSALPAPGEETGWPTRGGHPSRYSRPDFDCTSLAYQWHYSLKKGRDEGEEAGAFLDPATLRSLRARPLDAAVYPVVWNGSVYVFDDTALYPLDLASGELLFGPIRWDWSLLFGDDKPELESMTYSGTVAGGILYAVLNRRSRTFARPAEHRGLLTALDLSREAYPLWRRGGDSDSDGALAGVAFSGAPTVVEDRVYLLGTRYRGSGEIRAEAVLFCFETETGALVFDRFLCSGAEVDRFEIRLGRDNRNVKERVELGSPLAEYGGLLYALTNLGVAGAVDAFSGRIHWLFKYNRIASQDPDRYYRDFYLDTGGWRNGLPLVRDGRLYLTPRDSRFFYCLDLKPDTDGFIILDDPIEKSRMVSLIGMTEDGVYFTAREAGRNYIVATDRDGAVLWETPPFEKEDRIAGRPLLTARAIFIPTEQYIYRADLEKGGLLTHLFPLPEALRAPDREGVRFGNILSVKDYLVSVSREDVIVLKGVSE